MKATIRGMAARKTARAAAIGRSPHLARFLRNNKPAEAGLSLWIGRVLGEFASNQSKPGEAETK